MKTLVYKLNISDTDKELIKLLQHKYSIDFRRCYNNMELLEDKVFLSSLNFKSKRYIEYLIIEVKSFYKKVQSSKIKILNKINKLLEKQEKKPLTQKQFKKLQELKKSYNSKIVFGGKNNLRKRTKGLISTKEFKENRLYFLIFFGETYHKGNRFFDFKNLSNGQIIFKMEKTDIKINLTFSNHKHKEMLNILQSMSINNEISITIKLSHDIICISFDESKLYNSYMDMRKLSKSAPSKDFPIQRKLYWKLEYKKHEIYLKQGKFERYLSIDINPNQIGFIITDSDLNIIDKGSYEIEGKITSNKRKYEYSIIIKQLFIKVEHFKCSYFVMEELDKVIKEDHGNKTSNRKIKNEWKLNYLKELIIRRCNETKTILKKVNACYSSMIGNLTFNYYDTIASAMEIARRGINQYNKGFKLIPDIEPNNIITDKANLLRIDYNIDLNSIQNYQVIYNLIRKKNYRRKEKSFSSYLLTKKSNIILYV